MSRIRIRNKSKEQPGVDTASFKLGYQKGFREAEAVTLERLAKIYEPVEDENRGLKASIAALEQTNGELSRELARLRVQLVSQAKEKLAEEVNNTVKQASNNALRRILHPEAEQAGVNTSEAFRQLGQAFGYMPSLEGLKHEYTEGTRTNRSNTPAIGPNVASRSLIQSLEVTREEATQRIKQAFTADPPIPYNQSVGMHNNEEEDEK